LLLACLNLVPIESLIRSSDVLLETRWWLKSHLNRVLEHRDGESLGGHGSHPQSEVSVRLRGLKTINNCLKLRHETRSEMAIHEKCPSASASIVLNTSHGFLILTSTQGDGLELAGEVHLVSESLEIGNWIGTRGEHENQRTGSTGIFVGFLDTEGWRNNVLLTNLLGNEVLDSKWNLILSDSLDDDHLLEVVQFIVPISRNGLILWLG
jgi:hypothetical protein